MTIDVARAEGASSRLVLGMPPPEALLAPLPGALPTGQEAKHVAAYEAARAEVARMTAISPQPVDWSRVEETASEVLRAHAKDLLMAAYWAASAYQRRGLTGLGEGLSLVASLCERYGDGLFPSRVRARVGALEWLVDFLSQRLAQHQLAAADTEALAVLQRLAPQVGDVVARFLGDAAPSFRPLLDALRRLELSQPEPQGAEAPPPKPAPEHVAATQEPAPAPPSTETGVGDDPGQPAREAAARWLEPIDASEPAGRDARYDPRHEALRTEVGKLDLPSGGDPDWQLVRTHADVLLRDVSKDLVVATHLAQALWTQRRWDAVCTGMWLVHGLYARFGTELHPRRARARANALHLLAEKLDQRISELDASALSSVQVKALTAASEAMFTILQERAPEEAPPARAVASSLRRLELTVEERSADPNGASAGAAPAPSPATPPTQAALPGPATPPAAPASASTAPRPAAAPASPPPAPTAAPADVAQVAHYLRATGEGLVRVGQLLREASGVDPAGFRLRRLGAWLPLMRVRDEQMRASRLPPPAAPLRQRIELLHSQENWQTLLHEAEAALPLAPFWLDLQRFSARACEHLGPDYTAAAEAVTLEARALIARHPALLDLRFANDAPLASPETMAWLQAAPSAPAASTRPTDGPAEDAPPGLPEDLVERLKATPEAALTAAQRAIEEQRGERGRFAMRLRLARACQEAGLNPLAEALFGDLERAVNTHNLAAWDPELTISALHAYLNFLLIRGESKPGDPKVDSLRVRLAHLAPASLARPARGSAS